MVPSVIVTPPQAQLLIVRKELQHCRPFLPLRSIVTEFSIVLLMSCKQIFTWSFNNGFVRGDPMTKL